MVIQQIINEFKGSFDFIDHFSSRGIGIECEIPIVTQKGEAIGLSMIQNMFIYLEKKGFELERDNFSNLITAATKTIQKSASTYKYHNNTITTDVGFSIVEIVLAPQDNLHKIQTQLSELLDILITYFDSQNCLLLGYGIQPITPPSRKLLMPGERYSFFEKFSDNRIIPESEGADSDLLNITASNQCHIEIGLKDAIVAVNVLNALSGLQIAFYANSPIWQGNIDPNCKANREMFWDYCFPNRRNQIGIPPKFESIEDYIQYLLKFQPLLVRRNEQYLQVINKRTVKDFLFDKPPTFGKTLNGEKISIYPEATDIHQLIPFSWFNARLVPKYGTVESRMCCQQPPKETLTSTALTLGLLENLEAAQELADIFTMETWQEVRQKAVQDTFCTVINGISIVPLLARLLDIAKEGLMKRNLEEEKFLRPLYKRLKQQQSPADLAISIFKKQGMNGFLKYHSFKKERTVELAKNRILL